MADVVTSGQAQEFLDDEALAEEKLLEELENEEIPAHIRDARMQSLKKQASHLQAMKENQHGMYTVIEEEKEFLNMTTKEDKCIVHFFHQDFRRCAIMDTHLKKLSEKYFEVKFAKINVDIAKFFVEKLKIRMLPNIVCFQKGIVVDRIVGFEELGNTDDFTTDTLERRIARSGLIETDLEAPEKKTIFGYKGNDNDSDSD